MEHAWQFQSIIQLVLHLPLFMAMFNVSIEDIKIHIEHAWQSWAVYLFVLGHICFVQYATSFIQTTFKYYHSFISEQIAETVGDIWSFQVLQ